jgi:hypothetical protein
VKRRRDELGRGYLADLDIKVSAAARRPRPSRISTSYVERQNLTMRMGMRRFTWLTNGFSKKIENHIAAVAIHFMHYKLRPITQEPRQPMPTYSGYGRRRRRSRLDSSRDR